MTNFYFVFHLTYFLATVYVVVFLMMGFLLKIYDKVANKTIWNSIFFFEFLMKRLGSKNLIFFFLFCGRDFFFFLNEWRMFVLIFFSMGDNLIWFFCDWLWRWVFFMNYFTFHLFKFIDTVTLSIWFIFCLFEFLMKLNVMRMLQEFWVKHNIVHHWNVCHVGNLVIIWSILGFI